MDATPSFGVTMISEVPSNPQLTLGENGSQNSDHIFWTRKYEFAYFWAPFLLLAYSSVNDFLSDHMTNWYHR